jgi:hypothetical protein
MRPGTGRFQLDVRTVIYNFWENRLELFSILSLLSLLTTKRTQPLGPHNRDISEKRWKIQRLGQFRIEDEKLLSFFSNISPLFFLFHVYLFLWFSFCLLPHGWLNYPLLGFKECNWYLCYFSSNYVIILMIALLWSFFVIYLYLI